MPPPADPPQTCKFFRSQSRPPPQTTRRLVFSIFLKAFTKDLLLYMFLSVLSPAALLPVLLTSSHTSLPLPLTCLLSVIPQLLLSLSYCKFISTTFSPIFACLLLYFLIYLSLYLAPSVYLSGVSAAEYNCISAHLSAYHMGRQRGRKMER